MRRRIFTRANVKKFAPPAIIIIIIAGSIVWITGFVIQNIKAREAETMIANLELAVSAYHADTGKYPADDGLPDAGTKGLYDHLVNEAYADGKRKPRDIPRWNGPYMEFESKDLMGTTPEQIKDPWGNFYHYNSATPNNGTFVDLWSNGPDRKNGWGNPKDKNGRDDIKNWE